MKVGLIFRISNCWVGAHYLAAEKRLCINVIPFLTLWITFTRGSSLSLVSPCIEYTNSEDATCEALQLLKEIDEVGTKKYYNNENKLHREFGPAIESVNGHKEWYQNGKLHRLGGPAVENSNGSKFWYVNGERHRVDGPAVVYADGSEICYLNSQILSREDFLKHPLCTMKK